MQVDPHPLLRVALQSVRDAVVTTDAQGRVLTWNAAAEDLTGWLEAEVQGRAIEDAVNLREYGSDLPRPNPVYLALKEGRRVDNSGHALLIGKNGRRLGVEIFAAPLLANPSIDHQGEVSSHAAEKPRGCLLIFYDASEAIRLAERFAYLDMHDPLTGLPNRILLLDRLEQATRLADRTSDHLVIIFLDLDRFHDINESLGHAAGDQLLREVAFRLTGALRESDTVCRLGGDEFVLLVRSVPSLSTVETLVAKVQREIAQPCTLHGPLGEVTVEATCSMGISLYPRDADDAETLMQLADGAMHRAKQSGRNRSLFARPHPHAARETASASD